VDQAEVVVGELVLGVEHENLLVQLGRLREVAVRVDLEGSGEHGRGVPCCAVAADVVRARDPDRGQR
jgi:hypothetical protein